MSQRICQTIADLTKHGGCLVAHCACGRVAIFSIHQLSALFRAKRWSQDIRSVGARLRCTGCGKRGQRVSYSQDEPPDWSGLVTVVHPPRGIDAVAWAKADERERKRLVQRVRG